MKFNIFGLTILTGKSADTLKEAAERTAELSESLQGVGTITHWPEVLAHAKSQLDSNATRRQALYGRLAELIIDRGDVPGYDLERVVDQMAESYKTALARASYAEGQADSNRERAEKANEQISKLRNMNRQKVLSIRLALHVIGEYAGRGSQVGAVAEELMTSISGTELLTHELGHPAILDATPEQRKAWRDAIKSAVVIGEHGQTMRITDQITGTWWDRMSMGVLDHTPPPGGISDAHQAMADHLNGASVADGSVTAKVVQAIKKESLPGGLLWDQRNRCE